MYKDLCVYSGFTNDEKYLWYIGLNNQIMQIDIQTGKGICLGIIPGMYGREYAYRTLVYLDNVIYLIPYYADKLCTYDLTTRKFEFIEFPSGIFASSEVNKKIFGCIVHEDDLVLYGINPVVILFNIKTYKFRSFYINMEEAKRYGVENINFWRDGFAVNDLLVIPLDYSNCFFEINLQKNQARLMMLGDKYIKTPFQLIKKSERYICRMISDEEWNVQIFIIDKECQEKQTELCRFYVEHDGIPQKEQVPFLWGEIVKDKLVLLPAYQEKTYVIELQTGKVSCFTGQTIQNNVKSKKANPPIRNYFAGVCVNENTFATIHEEYKKLVLIFGEDPQQEKSIDLTFDDFSSLDYHKMVFTEILKTMNRVYEQESFSLVDYLKCIENN